MTDDTGPEPERTERLERPRVTMRQMAASYRPRRIGDFIFLHGLARIAARQTQRAGDRLYVPREWEGSHRPNDPDG